ncbi:hypothetical protein ACFPMF_14215 [Larkinella bovis]|uniref:Uncharacterized protein n=1 Tax=Larkinella bovis TaxID=683041 RepID=A0ABW0IDD7_9BACT
MSFRRVPLFFVFCLVWLLKTGSAFGQETASVTAGSNFPNRFTGRQIVVELGSGENRSEYRLLDTGLLYYRKGSEGPFTQLGQQKKDSTQKMFARLEQDCKIKTAKQEKPEKPDVTITWKKAKTEFAVGWENGKAPDVCERFYERFMEMFPKSRKK